MGNPHLLTGTIQLQNIHASSSTCSTNIFAGAYIAMAAWSCTLQSVSLLQTEKNQFLQELLDRKLQQQCYFSKNSSTMKCTIRSKLQRNLFFINWRTCFVNELQSY